MDTDDPKFMPQLLALRRDVRRPARAEERYAFTHVRRTADPNTPATVAKGINAAEGHGSHAPAPRRGGRDRERRPGPRRGPHGRTKDAVRKAGGTTTDVRRDAGQDHGADRRARLAEPND
ncbi:hypothetical protein [Streptomyces griseus]|uniref:hypothetical protein n=1 Tax=Streptomyces griseus TaxID=1911 RepID=UPI000690B8B0|nr:hypothetical protein [Streptomyces griseus]